MGVAGCGKSVVGAGLAAALGAPFLEGDDLHPDANRRKMTGGQPLTDADRAPWLDAVGHWLADHPEGVASCSALKRAYRDRLRVAAPGVRFVHLAGDGEVASARVAARAHHFMPAALVDSQLRDLEPLGADEAGLTLDFARPVDDLVHAALTWLRSAVP